jgi:hypothetical protein
MTSNSLTLRRQKFVSEYVETGNATEAARLAGYSPRTAYSQGSRLGPDDRLLWRAPDTQAGERLLPDHRDQQTYIWGWITKLLVVLTDAKSKPN